MELSYAELGEEKRGRKKIGGEEKNTDRFLNKFSIFLSSQKTSRRERVSSHENCVVAVFELERITGVAELNEGCRRARLLRDRCCHGDTNPVLRQFTISTRAIPPTSSQGAIHICEVTFQWPFCIGTRNDGSSPLLPTLFVRVLPLSTFRSNSFFLGKKIRPISTTTASSKWKKTKIGSPCWICVKCEKTKIPVYAATRKIRHELLSLLINKWQTW